MTVINRSLVATICTFISGFAQETSRSVIKTETRVVLVDAVVTNKKGEPVHGLTQKDFKVLEDNREQAITSFSFEADPASPVNDQPRYLMFFFDNATIDLPHQQPIRDAAAQFVATAAGPRRLMSVVEYGPGMKIAQDFTGDGEKLKQAISAAKLAHSNEGAYDARGIAFALESMAKHLAKVPGRKSLILVSGGLSNIPIDHMARLTDALNKANVAVYPGVDLAGTMSGRSANLNPKDLDSLQGGGSGGDNQQIMRSLMDNTGGSLFYLKDLSGGFERIGKEQNEYYLLGYSPDSTEEGKCHHLRIKMAQSGLTVRARNLYCPVKSQDLLSGTPVEKDLDNMIGGAGQGDLRVSLQAPFFYTDSNTVRMAVALDLPTSAVKFEKRKGGKFHGQLNLLGVIYRQDGGTAARFSDTVQLDFDDKKALENWQRQPTFYYEKDIDGLSGTYTMKLAASSTADHFAKAELPLTIDAYDGQKLGLSGIAFATKVRKLDANPGADSVESEDATPLVANGMQFFPSARTTFKKTEAVALYAEFYEPALKAAAIPKDLVVAVRMRLTEAKTGKVRLDSGVMRQDQIKAGQPVVPVALSIPVGKLDPGEYNCELGGGDTSGGQVRRVVKFTIE